jgi:hypothetical protein
MTTQALAPLSRCADVCGLSPKEMIVGSRPRVEHGILAERYFCSSKSGKEAMRVAMVSAIRAALKDHQLRPAAELFVALRVMLAGRQGHLRAARRHDRRRFGQRRQAFERFLETRCEQRAPASAVIVNLAERRAARATARASAESDAFRERIGA